MFTQLLAHSHSHAVALIWSPITSPHWHVAPTHVKISFDLRLMDAEQSHDGWLV